MRDLIYNNDNSIVCGLFRVKRHYVIILLYYTIINAFIGRTHNNFPINRTGFCPLTRFVKFITIHILKIVTVRDANIKNIFAKYVFVMRLVT